MSNVLSALPLPELPYVETHTAAESLLKKLHSGQADLFGVKKTRSYVDLSRSTK